MSTRHVLILVLCLMVGSYARAAIGGDGVNTRREKLSVSQSVYTPRDELIPGIPMPPQRPKPPDIGEQWKNLPWLQLFDGKPYGAFAEIKPYVKPRARSVNLKQLREIAEQFDEDMTDEELLAREQYYKEQAEIEARKEALTTPLPKVWMLVSSADDNRSHLVEFSKKPKTLMGCLMKVDDGSGRNSTYENIVRSCGGELRITKKVATYLDQCLPLYYQDTPTIFSSQSDEKAKLLTTHYFLYDKGRKAVCLHALSAEMPTKKLGDKPSANDEVAVVATIEANLVPTKDRSFNDRAINQAFGSAPYWGDSEHEFPAIACMHAPWSIAAYSRKDYWTTLSSSQDTDLTSPLLIWTYTYLVRHDKPISCSSAGYFVDFVNGIDAVLPDRTVLLIGQRTVLRVRIDDGSTAASASKVRSIPPKQFIERMQLDGGAGCVKGNINMLCHWLDIESRKSDSEIAYAKYWYEGFDRAVSRVYFSK